MKIFKFAGLCILIVALLTGMAACGNNAEESFNQQSTDQQALPEPDPNASVDGLLGSWTQLDAEGRFANITKSGTEYQYEDNEGKYTGTYKNGVLQVNVMDSDIADVFVDAKTGRMLLVYQGTVTEFKKK
jgi:hypothetical protein